MLLSEYPEALTMDIVRSDLSKRKRLKQMLWIVACVFFVSVSIVFIFVRKPGPVSVERERVWIGKVSKGSMLRQVRGAGTLVPADIRWVSARSSARIERILVLPGAMVEPDTIIMELSNPELSQETQAAQFQLNSEEADFVSFKVELESRLLDIDSMIHRLQAQLEQADLEARINKELFEEGIESELAMKRAELNVVQIKNELELEEKRYAFTQKANTSQISASESRIRQTRARYELLKERLDGLTVRAGFAGVLQRQTVEEGQQVSTGQSLSQVADPRSLKAVIRISEHQAKDVIIGQSAKIDTRNGVMDGRVIRVDPNVEEGTVAVDVELLGTPGKGMRPDLTVEGIIEIDRIESTVYADRPVYARPDGEGSVFRFLPGSDIAERTKIRYGKASTDTIEVLQGLTPGDRIILSDTADWEDKEQIRVY